MSSLLHVFAQDEAPLCTTAACTATRARAAAAIIALGLPYSETTFKPVFARGSCPAFLAPTAAALAAAELAASVRAATGRDVQCSLGRDRRSAVAAPQSPPLPPEPVVFNVMAVGGNGLGKSTLLHAMFAHEEFSERYPGLFPRTKRTVQVRSSHVLAEAAGRPLHLTLVDTPGLGDAADHARRFADILAYIDECYCDYFNQDTDAHTRSRSDRRIHCCLYFIEPTGHDLQPFDVECMKELQDRVNVIPVIAKADTMSTYECYRFKRRLLREIAEQQIDVYDFPEVNPQEEQLRALKERLPFAVVGFNSELHEYGRKMMARRYPWGIAEVETLEHNDFSLLRKVLLQIHLCNLKEATEVHYENYRCRTLTPLSFDDFENLDDSKMENNRYYITFKPSISSSIVDTLNSLNVVSSSSSSK
ncbi:hypothetical protein R5R35_003766 [Gryllus longicercus]|uniref:Septin-type G domain-containing protein n=1 Tax=Gryllus longicercus TaxID=2509291 RepID=A0AAN9YYU8_9ORTH